MRALRAIGRFFWRFMVVFSFIVNIILVVVLIVLGLLIFEIKNEVAQPLITGLHSSFVGLDQATIDTTIPVRDSIDLDLQVPLDTRTTVVLAREIPLDVDASIVLNGQRVPVDVRLALPEGLQLDVFLNLTVPVQETVPVDLDVRAVIPLQQTQLHDVAENLRLQLEPLAFALNNLPNDFGGAIDLVGDVIFGDAPDLLATEGCNYCQNPWPGYSITAGYNYELFGEPIPAANIPLSTGIVPVGGMPLLDEEMRPELYQSDNTPETINAQAYANLSANNIPAYTYDGSVGSYRAAALAAQAQNAQETQGGIGSPTNGETSDEDLGIIPPTSGG
jgi:hypothetical protein